MPTNITREDILTRLCALPINDPLHAVAYRMEGLLDQLEAEGLRLMQLPATHAQGEVMVNKARRSRSGSTQPILHWLAAGPNISPDFAELFSTMLDEAEGTDD
jgi:hypothetical protein